MAIRLRTSEPDKIHLPQEIRCRLSVACRLGSHVNTTAVSRYSAGSVRECVDSITGSAIANPRRQRTCSKVGRGYGNLLQIDDCPVRKLKRSVVSRHRDEGSRRPSGPEGDAVDTGDGREIPELAGPNLRLAAGRGDRRHGQRRCRKEGLRTGSRGVTATVRRPGRL
jgi:hypothetical protein